MVDQRLAVCGVLFFCVTMVAGCASGDAMSIDEVRKTAVDAGEAPISCPIPYDVSKALPGNHDVQPGKVEIEVSKTTTPVADQVSAEVDDKMSVIDATAGVSIDCQYKVGDKSVDVWLVATPRTGAVSVLAPQLSRSANMDSTQLQAFVDQQPNVGDVKLAPGDTVAVGRLRLQGKADAALFVDPDGLSTGKDLEEATKTLLSQIKR
jgi:hypothetical protein